MVFPETLITLTGHKLMKEKDSCVSHLHLTTGKGFRNFFNLALFTLKIDRSFCILPLKTVQYHC